MPDSGMIVEGKLDHVGGKHVLLTTGCYGFRTYDVSDPAHPVALDSFQPAEILGENGYWQDEDMEVDTRRKLIIGALDPASRRRRSDELPGHRHALGREPQSQEPQRLLRVNVDDHSIAWTSGRGGILGYATRGFWRDPYTDRRRWARPWNP